MLQRPHPDPHALPHEGTQHGRLGPRLHWPAGVLRCIGIQYGSIKLDLRARGHSCGLDPAGRHDVKHLMPSGKQVIRNNAPVAAPPNGLGAHHRATVRPPQLCQGIEAFAKSAGSGIIGIISKRFILPKRVRRRRLALDPPPQTSQRLQMPIPNARFPQACRQRLDIVLGIGAGTGHRSNIGEQSHLRFVQKLNELRQGPGGMADCEEWSRMGQGVLYQSPEWASFAG